MHVTLILWISLLLSTAVGSPEHQPTEDEIKALMEGQVIWTSRWHNEGFDRAIVLGHTHLPDKSDAVKLVKFGQDLPPPFPLSNLVEFAPYFAYEPQIRDRAGSRIKLKGKINLGAVYAKPRNIRIPSDRVILRKDNMKRLKAAISVALVNDAHPLVYSHLLTNVGQINHLAKGQVIWVWSKIMYGEQTQQQRHQFHFAIFLGRADPQHGSTLPDVLIAQIVMDLPLPVLPENRVDFDAYFPTTWWQQPAFAFDGEIDLKLHKIPPAHIRIPNEILQLDPKGVKKLETAMGIGPHFLPGHNCGRGRSSSVPANCHMNMEQFDESENGQTPVTGLTRSTSFGSRNGR